MDFVRPPETTERSVKVASRSSANKKKIDTEIRANMIYCDATDIINHNKYNSHFGGIQRVSAQLIQHMINIHGMEKVRIVALHPAKRQMILCGRSSLESKFQHSNDKDNFDFQSYLQTEKQDDDKVLLLCHNDTIFVPGAPWGLGSEESMLELYKSVLSNSRLRLNFRTYHFIHDIMPLIASEYFEEKICDQFLSWLKHLSRNTDCFIVNSDCTKIDLDAWLKGEGVNVPVRAVPLAHQFRDCPRQEFENQSMFKKARADVRSAARLPYALCVGTLESRKNIWTLATVWRQVHEKLGYATPRLIFAGKSGWLSKDFDDFLAGTGSLGGYIRIIENPSDDDLAFLYKNCVFSIYPSYREGWGLPIGESLWFGKPVITSCTSAMPEVGRKLADYIDPYSPQSIEDAVIRLATDSAYRASRADAISGAELRTWKDVADDIWRELMCSP